MSTTPTNPKSRGQAAGSPVLRYTGQDSERAYKEWKATCGPHALAAMCGISLDSVRAALPSYKGWMNPTMVGETLRTLDRAYTLRAGLKTSVLCDGLNRLQWEGSWLNPGVPARIAYFHTHWVAHISGWVLCTACAPDRWIPESLWRDFLAAQGKPFHITHHYCLENSDLTERPN